MNTEKILIGILASITAGAVLGVLFAPDKGSNTRKKITDNGHAMAGDLESKYDNMKSEISKIIDRVKNEYGQILQDKRGLEEDVLHIKSQQEMDGKMLPYHGKVK